jgi:hypothetical protein
VNGLSDIAAPAELWALYQKEENKELRAQMVSVFSSMGAVELTQIVKTEKEPTVRAATQPWQSEIRQDRRDPGRSTARRPTRT